MLSAPAIIKNAFSITSARFAWLRTATSPPTVQGAKHFWLPPHTWPEQIIPHSKEVGISWYLSMGSVMCMSRIGTQI